MLPTKRPPQRQSPDGSARQLLLELPATSAPEDDEPRRRLSVVRALVALIILSAGAYVVFLAVRSHLTAPVAGRQTTFFAPYVDVTATPTYPFQSLANDPAHQTVLGFVVAASPTRCAPTWGGVYDLAAAGQSLGLGARIAQLKSDGATPIVSFGGQRHTSLAMACANPQALAKAYASVVDRYGLRTIDLDIEGAALDSFAASQRRAAALRLVERQAARAGHPLQVWLTLPVATDGLQDNALSVIGTMFRDRVHLAGIDVMAMDFRRPPTGGQTMLDLVDESLQAAHSQLARLFPTYGIHLSSAEVWRRMGVTVMIGQNNLVGERFTVQDATGLRSFATSVHLGRLSMWSINRDAPCLGSEGVAVLSTTCSGTVQADLEFTGIFDHLPGLAGLPTSGTGPSVELLRPVSPDTNPANAPYPAWNATASYAAGYKVVENGEIYEAKWYNSAQDPGAQYQYSWQSPWQLLGPVLPSDRSPVIPAPPAGTYPSWRPSALYVAGQKIVYHRLAYQAKWSNQGIAPGRDAALQPTSPWQPLFSIPGEPSATAG